MLLIKCNKGVINVNKLKYFSIHLAISYVMILLLLLVTSAIFAYTNLNDKYLDIFAAYVSYLNIAG
jgi:hypothetical protein